jgi:hypothetical protein
VWLGVDQKMDNQNKMCLQVIATLPLEYDSHWLNNQHNWEG